MTCCGVVGHFRHQRHFRIIGIAEQGGHVLTIAQNLNHARAELSKLARLWPLIRCPRDIGRIHRLAQAAIFRMHHDGQIRGRIQCDAIPGLFFLLCAMLLSKPLAESGKPLKRLSSSKAQFPRLGRIEHAVSKARTQLSKFFLNIGKAFFLIRR
jgi:hypothetical protein